MTSSFSVTSVRVAFECPRLFYLSRRFGGMTLFLPSGGAGGIGKAFHGLSGAFIRLAKQEPRFEALFEPKVEHLDAAAIALQLQHLFYELKFFPYLQAAIHRDPAKAQTLNQLWQGLQGLIRRWAELLVSNRRYCDAAEVIHKTFLAQELLVQHSFSLPDGTQQLVRGRYDSLVYDFDRHRLCVVEYKTYESPDPAAQLAQVALYGYMLQEKIGVPIDSALYTVLPDWKELTFSWQQLANAVHTLIPARLQQMQQWLVWEPTQPDPPPATPQPDRLCPICPQRKKCQTFFQTEQEPAKETFPPATVLPVIEDHQSLPDPPSRPQRFVSSTPAPDAIAAGMGEQLVATLRSFGVIADYQGAAIGPAFIRVKLKPHPGVKVSSLLRLSDDLRVQLGLTYPPMIAPQAGYVSVDLPRPDRQIAAFEQYIQPQISSPPDPMRIAIGVNLDGNLIEADLADPNTCHFLVGGTTGSGKSEFLRSLLLSLLVRHSPDHLKIILIDPKRVTFPEFEQMPWLDAPVAKDSDRAIALMERLVDEMNNRYQQFEMTGCSDLNAYNQRSHQRVGQPSKSLPRIVCIFDEYADFMAEKETRIGLEQSIKRLGAMSRAAGIHLIIATQRPEARVVTPLIRSNLPGRVALRTASEADSAIVLGGKETAAASLLGKGDLLYQTDAHLLRLQSLFIGGNLAKYVMTTPLKM